MNHVHGRPFGITNQCRKLPLTRLGGFGESAGGVHTACVLTLTAIASAAVLGRGLEEEAATRGCVPAPKADLELEVSVRYWEGAVEARGTTRGVPVTGTGYLELIGYADG